MYGAGKKNEMGAKIFQYFFAISLGNAKIMHYAKALMYNFPFHLLFFSITMSLLEIHINII